MPNIAQYLFNRARSQPEAPALSFGEHSLGFGQLADRAKRLGAALVLVLVASDRLSGTQGMPVDSLAAVQTPGSPRIGGHPDLCSFDATGVGQLYEVVRQLRGTHPNQVRDAEIGMTHNLGGAGVSCTVSLLRRPA